LEPPANPARFISDCRSSSLFPIHTVLPVVCMTSCQ
jgi:hypothetical protein